MTHAPLAVGDVVRTPNALYALVLDTSEPITIAVATSAGIAVGFVPFDIVTRVDSVFDVPRESLVALYAYSEQLARRERVGGGR